jgi:hypothetical protein
MHRHDLKPPYRPANTLWQPGLRLPRLRLRQAVMRLRLGMYWLHSLIASPVQAARASAMLK